jgi:hypothetical protein
VALARALQARQHADPLEAGSGGASMWPIGDRPDGVVV